MVMNYTFTVKLAGKSGLSMNRTTPKRGSSFMFEFDFPTRSSNNVASATLYSSINSVQEHLVYLHPEMEIPDCYLRQ